MLTERKVRWIVIVAAVVATGYGLARIDVAEDRQEDENAEERATTTTRRSESQTSAEGDGIAAVVESITDGDTFRTEDGERIRLIGIDAPELDGPSCFGPEATDALAELIPPGSEVRLELDRDPTDRFGRTLAYVHAADGTFVNRELVLGGFAIHVVVAPNDARVSELAAAQDFAQDTGRGLWGACPPPAALQPPASQPPATAPPIDPVAGPGCDAAYPDVCIPSPPPDLDCGDIPHRRFRVLPPDPHGFDGNDDGIGCESS